uniref:Betaine--homocysteine S-methyltransferase 1 n=1 Tax=Hydra vulgaris TaxID=6087 RepID=T2M8L7_HYDVU
MAKRGLLERLKAGEVVIGDGGFVFELEKRGYVKAGPWTPEAVIEAPEAVKQLHREFLRAGSNVMQTFTFYASEDKLDNRGNEAATKYGVTNINKEACRIAREVADEGDALVAGGVCQTPAYLSSKGKDAVQAVLRKQIECFVEMKVDFMICEYFEHIEEMEWAIETCKEAKMPICSTMCIGPEGDMHGISAAECAVRMAKAGADVVGVNCHFGPYEIIETMKRMKQGLDDAGLNVFLMSQPLAYVTPDAKKQGFIDLPEFPFALEPRICTRWDIQKYAREAYKLGVRYIGGCCGFQPYHIRAITEELEPERGVKCKGSVKHGPWGQELALHTKPWVRKRANRKYWENLKPASGRPFCPSCSVPDEWGVTAGDELLKQHKEATTKEELEELAKKE